MTSLKKFWHNISSFLSKKQEQVDYPYEFFIIQYSDYAKKHALFEDWNKEIKYHKGDLIRIYNYSEEKIEALTNDGVPHYDMTTEKYQISILKKINPAMINYEEEVK